MKIHYILFLSLLVIGIFTFSYHGVHALFTSAAQNQKNTFTAALTFPLSPTAIPSGDPTLTLTPTPSATPSVSPSPSISPKPEAHIVINEVSSLGGNDKDWVELFNPTNTPVNISGWSITDNSSSDTIPSVQAIPPAGFAVVITSSSSISVPGSALTVKLSSTTIGNGLSENGDRVILKNAASVTIDAMSYGSDTTVFASPPGKPTGDKTVSRHPNGIDTDSASDWTDEEPTLGITNL